jgi:hypothetical protein
MLWVLQDNLFHEAGYERLITGLARLEIPHQFVKVVPFSHDLVPDISPANPVYICGSLTLAKIAKRKGWLPGAFMNDNFDFAVWGERYGDLCLNHDARVVAFKDVRNWGGKFFIRPTLDSKSFAGMTTTWTKFAEWQEKVLALGKDEYSTLPPETMVLVAPLKDIAYERRYFIVDGAIVTSSEYKRGSRVIYSDGPDEAADAFVRSAIERFQPDRAFVIDVAMIEDGFRIVEINCLNSAGFYAADCMKLIMAIESMAH